MFPVSATVSSLLLVALFWSTGIAIADNIAQTPTPPKPVYQPPLRGAPDRRIGGGTRGGSIDLSVIAPKQSSWTSQEQPRVYWFISAIPEQGHLAFTLTKAASSAQTLLEAFIPMPATSGIQSYRLAGYRLEPGVEYVWSVSLSFGQDEDKADQVARGGIIYHALPPDEKLEWSHLKENELALLQAQSGYWYDAIDSVSMLIDTHTQSIEYWEWRKDLLRQVGLETIADFSRP